MHLRLIKGLSYDGVVRASAAHPDVFVDDPEKYTALLESGYFEALPDAHTVTGHLDADFLGEMDEEQLNKLADDMASIPPARTRRRSSRPSPRSPWKSLTFPR